MEEVNFIDPLGPAPQKTLHFIWIADCSGSMHGKKIEQLNMSIREAIPPTREECLKNPFSKMLVRAIKFSNGAQWHVGKPIPIENFDWKPLTAGGRTDLGKAFRELKKELTVEKLGKRNLPPVLVLLSDGNPTDDWDIALQDFNDSDWGKTGRTVRAAIAVGRDANKEVLAKFTGNIEMVFEVNGAQQLKDVILWASVVLSSHVSSGKSELNTSSSSSTTTPLPAKPQIRPLSDEEEIW